MEIDRINMKFRLEAGAIIKSTVKNHLNRMKRDLEWRDRLISVDIYEEKYLLSSTFEVQIKHILESDAKAVESAVEKYVAQLGA